MRFPNILGIDMKRAWNKFTLWLLLISPFLYVTTCTVVSDRKATAFSSIDLGDTRDKVISQFGMPSHIEHPEALFTRYTSNQCQNACVERLWFENRLSFDIEAWSVELDKNDRVIEKSYYVSP
jgi:hypothetical protein